MTVTESAGFFRVKSNSTAAGKIVPAKPERLIPVRKYDNKVRLACAMDKLKSEANGFRFICVQGNFKIAHGHFVAVGDTIIAVVTMVTAAKETDMAILYYGDCSELDGNKEVALEDLPKVNICQYLAEQVMFKYENTKNPFSLLLTFKDGKEAVLSAGYGEEDSAVQIQVMSKDTSGKVEYVTSNTGLIADQLSQAINIIEFRYTVKAGDSGSKSVSVKRSRIELYREIARYLNRTVALVSYLEQQSMLTIQYISATECLELSMHAFGMQVYRRKPLVRLSSTLEPRWVFLSSAAVNEIARGQGKVLAKGSQPGTKQ